MTEENFKYPPNRTWKSRVEDSTMRCYLRMEGRVSVRQIFEHFAEHYPHVNPAELRLNFATATWEEPATAEDLAKRADFEQRQAERCEAWERKTYERLRAKFEDAPVSGR